MDVNRFYKKWEMFPALVFGLNLAHTTPTLSAHILIKTHQTAFAAKGGLRMRNKKYARLRPSSSERLFRRGPFVRMISVMTAVLLLIGSAIFTVQLRKAESVFLENGAQRWGVALLAECADAGMAAAGDNLISMERDAAGDIQLISVDPTALHTLRTEALRQAETLLNEDTVNTVQIPLGTIFASEFFSGLGPRIRFSFVPAGNVTLLCRSSLESAGINQTAYRVTLSMTMEVSAVTSFSTHQVTVPYEVVVAETMIVGDVPAVYAYGAKDSIATQNPA